MRANERYSQFSFEIGLKVLDFGLCNGFAYLINADGEIWVNRLAVSAHRVFELLRDKKIDSVFERKDFIRMAVLDSFPLDSVCYGNKLFVATESGTTVLNLSVKPKKVRLKNYPDLNPISITKHNGILFFSLGEQGLATLRPSFYPEDFLIQNTPSSHIVANRDVIVSLYPENTPVVFRIGYCNDDCYRRMPLSMTPPILTMSEEASGFFKNHKVSGRDIVAPYSYQDKIILPDIDGSIFSMETLRKGREDVKVLLKQHKDSGRKMTVGSLLDYDSSELMKTLPILYVGDEEPKEPPIARYPHPDGIIEEYWDRVVFAGNSGERIDLVKDEEISEVRTYADNRYYCSLITIATEKSCRLINVYDSNKRTEQRNRYR